MPQTGKRKQERKGKLHKHLYSLTFNFKNSRYLIHHHQKHYDSTTLLKLGDSIWLCNWRSSPNSCSLFNDWNNQWSQLFTRWQLGSLTLFICFACSGSVESERRCDQRSDYGWCSQMHRFSKLITFIVLTSFVFRKFWQLICTLLTTFSQHSSTITRHWFWMEMNSSK